MAGQIGLEPTPDEYVARIVAVFAEVRRVLRDNGTLWLNIGDCYAGHTPVGFRPGNEEKNGGASNKNGVGFVDGLKPKDLVGMPWRLAFALQADGWYLRSDIIWSKPDPMPESVTDRPTKSHEYVFLLSKSERYYYDAKAIAEPVSVGARGSRFTSGKTAKQGTQTEESRTRDKQAALGKRTYTGFNGRWDAAEALGLSPESRNARTVWTIASQPYAEAHFAVMPLELARRCILAGCPESGAVLDPFMGAGTVALAAQELGRRWIGIELNPEYASLIQRRVQQTVLPLAQRTED